MPMNKQLLVVLPVMMMVAGCNAQGEHAEAPTTPAEIANVANASTPMKATPAKAVEKKAPATNTSAAPDPKYKIVDEANPQMPAKVLAALDKVKVSPPPANMTVPKKARLRLLTSKGAITVELNEVAAPLQVKSFIYLAKKGFFDSTVLHRYEPGFVIQGGDPLSKSPALKEFYGTGGPGYQIPRERNSLKHDKLVLAAARSSDPDSAGSQFYITLAPAPFLDEGDGYTVFGKVVDGGDNVMKLRAGDKLEKVVLLPVAPAKKTS